MANIPSGISTVAHSDPSTKPTIDAHSPWQGQHHLLDTKSLSVAQTQEVLKTARYFRQAHITSPLELLKPYTVATLFYENSTRTRSSFELAAKRLGATVLNLDVAASSAAKGETLIDTAKTLAAMDVNLIVQRHSSSGSAHLLASALNNTVCVVNAGDGWNEHPTQALLDLLTMTDVCDDLRSAKIAIVGDILHSRVAHSNMWLLKKFGADEHVVGPPTLLPYGLAEFGITVHTQLEPALENADFIIVLRIQSERQQQGLAPSLSEYKRLYRLDHSRISFAAPTVRILDPGPVIRNLQITDELADDEKYSLITTQVRNGVFIRMAVLHLLLSQSV